MLKRLIVLILIILLLLLVGCTQQGAQIASIPSSACTSSSELDSFKTSSEPAPPTDGFPKSILPSPKSSSNAPDIAEVAERIYSSKEGMDFVMFAGSNAFLERFNEPYGFYSYSIETREMKKIGDIEPVIASSASMVIMQDKFLYYTDFVIKDGKELLRLIKVDLEGRLITAIDTSDYNNRTDPLTYLTKLNENEFLLIGMANDKSYIKRYDCRTNTGVEIISETVTAAKNAPNGYLGTVLSRMCVMDGEIYVIMLNLREDCVEYRIGVYDREGNKIRTISSNAVSDIFDFNKDGFSPLGMYGIGGYLVLENWNQQQAIYQIDGDMLTEIIPPNEDIRTITSGLGNYYRIKNSRYIFFQRSLNSEKDKDNILFALEVSTGEIKQAKIKLDEEYNILTYGNIDEYGNLIIRVCKEISGSPGSVDYSNYELFYIKENDLPKILQ